MQQKMKWNGKEKLTPKSAFWGIFCLYTGIEKRERKDIEKWRGGGGLTRVEIKNKMKPIKWDHFNHEWFYLHSCYVKDRKLTGN